MSRFFWLILLLLPFLASAQLERTPLNTGWTLQLESDDQSEAIPATVPGTVHTDLMNAGILPDFYTENNQRKYHWIEQKNWIYEKSFELSQNEIKKDYISLVCEGLDTYATLSINGEVLDSTDNMFVGYEFDIKSYIQEGTNTLQIHFESPINRNLPSSKAKNYRLPSGNETGDTLVSSYTRKAAYQFGWDFAPRAVSCGIWRPIYIESWNDLKIENLHITQESLTDERAIMNVQVDLKGQGGKGKELHLQIGKEAKNYIQIEENKLLNLKINIDNPKLWFPNGYGYQTIYSDTLFLYRSETLIDSLIFHYGIRQIDLHQNDDQHGKSFFFTVNGEPIFCKGANYVPQDMFLPLVSKEQTRELLLKVKKANMNMIRVWGGGTYESDYFYSLCDSLGILVWQDFMFANSLYPDDPHFIASIEEEVEYNIKRLRNHPSITLWCGSNEVEVAWENWGWQNQYGIHGADSIAVWNNYESIFHRLIPEQLRKLDREKHYISSSPISNWGNPTGLTEGCLHYWGVWHGKQALESFKTNVGRFVSEYGFPSYPSKKTLENYLSFKNDNLTYIEFDRRLKSYVGIQGIEQEVDRYFGSSRDPNDFIKKSQAIQAYAQRLAIQSHRLKAPFCMGSLSWQLNDCWPGPSWSLIDYRGTPKAAYYETMTQFLPVMVGAEVQNDTLIFRGVSDLSKKQQLRLEVHFTNENNEDYKELSFDFELKSLSPEEIARIDLKTLKPLFDPQLHFIHYSVKNRDTQEVIYGDNFFFLAPKNRSISVNKVE